MTVRYTGSVRTFTDNREVTGQARRTYTYTQRSQGDAPNIMTTFDLFSSVRDGNTDIVRRLLQSRQCRARLNDRNEWGDTALHLAAEAGNAEICQMLIAAGASVTVRNNRGETCLHRAAVGGHRESVRAIVGRDQDPDAVNSQNDAGYTALHHAAKHGSQGLIEILVKAGADRMLENNAGETPYMVAHKFQQWEAERLLLDVDQQHADRAMREMNRKEKEIIKAYLKAVKYASQLESRVRIMLIGDGGSGKSSLKKTLFGELYDLGEKPTSGIHADPSITRIKFKQFREWLLQPASKADAHRLNLEYTDIIIDYILRFLQHPRNISDDAIDPTALQIEKERVKSVNFDLTQFVIPEESIDEYSDEESDEDSMTGNEPDDTVVQEGPETTDDVAKEVHESEETQTSDGTSDGTSELSSGEGGVVEAKTDAKLIRKALAQNDIEYQLDIDNEDDRLHRYAQESEKMAPPVVNSKSVPLPPQLQKDSVELPRQQQTEEQLQESVTSTLARPAKPSPEAASLFTCSRGELSRLLVEKIPVEILKRMVNRWPVGEEQYQDRSVLNKNRLNITVWDVAGDPIQQNFTPLFFSNRSVYVATYDLSRDLNKPCETYRRRNLTNVDGSTPTNAQVLEGWIGCVTAFQKSMPSEPFRCTNQTPVLPPVIIACTHVDFPVVQNCPVLFHQFFGRKSFDTYKKHLVEAKAPCALRISNKYENDAKEGYSGHHLLRREIDHLTRQMPYTCDNVPVQWVKFEQLIYGLQEQRKVILLYEDLEKYISEHCQITGPLQILPVLSHFHDIGIIVYFYRHPELSNLVFTRPQWLINALSAVIASNPGKWITGEVQYAFKKLSQVGVIDKDMLQLAYRCARMPQRYWNEVLFVFNCMDLVCCHPALHEQKALYLPCMVLQGAPDPFIVPMDEDPATLYYSAKCSSLPIALFNQLVVRCIRSSQYAPALYYQLVHIQLNSTYHLLLWKESTAIVFLVQSNTTQMCSTCSQEAERHQYSPRCSHIAHLVGDEAEFLPSDNIAILIDSSTNSGVNPKLHLAFSDEGNSLDSVCRRVLSFMTENIRFLCHSWFPGLDLELVASSEDKMVILDQHWRHTVLSTGNCTSSIGHWFE